MDVREGMVQAYNYFAKDHLGNVRHVARVPFERDHEIVQVNNYYPFGGLHNDQEDRADIQNRLYNGKEYDRMHGLNLYDFSARQYDPAVGQFTSMDQHCENRYHVSPYVYCSGNPVNRIDPDGKDGVSIIDEENKIVTIKANYYVNTVGIRERKTGQIVCSGYSKNDIVAMNKMILDFNEHGYVINAGDYKGYSLKFDMTFIDGGNYNESSLKASMDYYPTDKGHIGIGNVIQRNYDSNDSRLSPKNDGDYVGGITAAHNLIIMNAGEDCNGDKLDNRTTRMHELFHTLGFDDMPGSKGIMDYSTLRINQEDINSILKNIDGLNKNKYEF